MEKENTLGRVAELEKQRDRMLAAAKQAAAEIRRCDYTPARSTLLVAIDAVEQPKPAADGWVEWKGGERPVPDGAIIWIRFRDGDECPAGFGEGLTWEHEGDAGDIIAYRVVQGGAA